MKREKQYVDTYYAKSPDYREELLRLKTEGKCPFCREYFLKQYPDQFLKQEGNCFIARLKWPYKDTETHLMIIPNTHKEFPDELTFTEWENMLRLLAWAMEEFHIPGGAIAMRFGDPKRTGATVLHLHLHIIVPELLLGEDRVKLVNFPIG